MGIFSKRFNREGAIAGMICGLGCTTAYIVWFKFISPESNTPDHWFLGISPEGFGTIGMLINFIVALTVSALTPPPPAEVQQLVESIRIPANDDSDHG